MTMKERVIRLIQTLPEDATLGEIVEKLHHLEGDGVTQPHGQLDQPSQEAGAWDLLRNSAGTLEMPADWASAHDYSLYGTSKRSSAA